MRACYIFYLAQSLCLAGSLVESWKFNRRPPRLRRNELPGQVQVKRRFRITTLDAFSQTGTMGNEFVSRFAYGNFEPGATTGRPTSRPVSPRRGRRQTSLFTAKCPRKRPCIMPFFCARRTFTDTSRGKYPVGQLDSQGIIINHGDCPRLSKRDSAPACIKRFIPIFIRDVLFHMPYFTSGLRVVIFFSARPSHRTN